MERVWCTRLSDLFAFCISLNSKLSLSPSDINSMQRKTLNVFMMHIKQCNVLWSKQYSTFHFMETLHISNQLLNCIRYYKLRIQSGWLGFAMWSTSAYVRLHQQTHTHTHTALLPTKQQITTNNAWVQLIINDFVNSCRFALKNYIAYAILLLPKKVKRKISKIK